jgi:hypothetical protein
MMEVLAIIIITGIILILGFFMETPDYQDYFGDGDESGTDDDIGPGFE